MVVHSVIIARKNIQQQSIKTKTYINSYSALSKNIGKGVDVVALEGIQQKHLFRTELREKQMNQQVWFELIFHILQC